MTISIKKRGLLRFILATLLGVLYGYSILRTSILLGVLSVSILYGLESRIYGKQTKVLEYFLYSTVFMVSAFLTCTWWFMKISATGWGNTIWIFSPKMWLLILLISCSIGAGLISAAPKALFIKIAPRLGCMKILLLPLLWSALFMLSEILFSLAFTVIVREGGAPLEPQWNFMTLSLLLNPSGYLAYILEIFGLWGTSFIVLLSVTIFYEAVALINTRKLSIPIAVMSTVMLVALNHYNIKNEQISSDTNVRFFAVSSIDMSNNYLNEIKKIQTSETTSNVVVLPEYSGLLRPYGDSSPIISDNSDHRASIVDTFKNTNITFIGTEDTYKYGHRLVESYVLNNKLEIIYAQPKTFLVPGGEYMIPWVGSVMHKLDPQSIDKFFKEMGRKVDVSFYNPNTIGIYGIGACSMTLLPHNYQEQVANGAEALTANISFSQFKDAPEYEQFSMRFSKLIARSLKRPFISSSYQGHAYFIDASGKTTEKVWNTVAYKDVALSKHRTSYSIAGDKFVVLGIITIVGLAVGSGILCSKYRLRLK